MRFKGEFVQHVVQHQSNTSAVKNVCSFAGITIEDDRRWAIQSSCAMKERVDLEAREVRDPNERWKIVDDDVANVGPGRFASRDRNSLDPGWSERGRVFLIERFAENAIWKALESNRTIF